MSTEIASKIGYVNFFLNKTDCLKDPPFFVSSY